MIWAEEAFEIRRKICLNFGEDLFFFEITCFWAEKSFEFSISAGNSASISDKLFESDSKAMRIRIKVAFSCLTLSKKPLPPFSNPGYAPGWSRGHKARGQGQDQGHKKIRGQGQRQPFRGQTLSRPRTGMLEAKAKDASASVLQKKGLQNFFFWRSLSNKQRLPKFLFRRSTKFQQFRKSAVLEPRTGQFSRT